MEKTLNEQNPIDQDDLATILAAVKFSRENCKDNPGYLVSYGLQVIEEWTKDFGLLEEKIQQTVDQVNQARAEIEKGKTGFALMGLRESDLMLIGISLEFTRDHCIHYEFRIPGSDQSLPLSAVAQLRERCGILNNHLLTLYNSKVRSEKPAATIH